MRKHGGTGLGLSISKGLTRLPGGEFSIDQDGMHVGKPFRNISGILSGHPSQIIPEEIDRVEGLFK